MCGEVAAASKIRAGAVRTRRGASRPVRARPTRPHSQPDDLHTSDSRLHSSLHQDQAALYTPHAPSTSAGPTMTVSSYRPWSTTCLHPSGMGRGEGLRCLYLGLCLSWAAVPVPATHAGAPGFTLAYSSEPARRRMCAPPGPDRPCRIAMEDPEKPTARVCPETARGCADQTQ